jgi:hypothetical protein
MLAPAKEYLLYKNAKQSLHKYILYYTVATFNSYNMKTRGQTNILKYLVFKNVSPRAEVHWKFSYQLIRA